MADEQAIRAAVTAAIVEQHPHSTIEGDVISIDTGWGYGDVWINVADVTSAVIDAMA